MQDFFPGTNSLTLTANGNVLNFPSATFFIGLPKNVGENSPLVFNVKTITLVFAFFIYLLLRFTFPHWELDLRMKYEKFDIRSSLECEREGYVCMCAYTCVCVYLCVRVFE